MKISLKKVRLSFPALFEKVSNPKFPGEPKFEATFLINKKTQKDIVETIDKAIDELLASNKAKAATTKICFKDGDEKEYDGYAGHMSLKARSSVRPTVVDRLTHPITAEDEKIYPGCYVNAVVDLWFSKNYGAIIGATLLGVQFDSDGEVFSSIKLEESDFEVLDKDDELFE
jgi:hypothetical protein